MAETGKKDSAAVAKKKAHGSRNFKLPGGVWRYSRSTMFSRRRLQKVKKVAAPKQKPKRKPKTIIKPIGGEKNGGTRVVQLKKRGNFIQLRINQN
ncbi:60S ribosomal protein L6 [Caerostris extrusa]|uniref:60S ribosomal protein L6 n=1 Tax=Caerostris extrusa TaxID=172846 RepID=A0AAV4QLP4_CAEEX|nr:60S ribosomal protein L6 [Caerostris extrusa]